MAVTQYIGARYVPLFADPAEWSANNQYEPLTIVIYQGASYTSKQAVPTGIDITNTDYWALTGNYNAQVEAYRQEVARFDGRITENAEAIDSEADARAQADTALGTRLTNEASARESADTALGARITNEASARESADTALGTRLTNEASARESADTQLQNRIGKLEQKEHVVIIGDSYLLGVHSDSSTSGSTNYGQWLVPWLSGRYDVHQYAQGGIGFWRSSPEQGTWTGMNYAQMINQIGGTYSDALKARTTKVFIQGGWNDANHFSDYNSQAITNAVNNARTHFPNATVYIFFTWGSGRPLSVDGAKTFNKYVNDGTWNGAVIGESININFALTTPSHDNIHPTASQQRYIAGLAYDLIMDGWNGDYTVGDPNGNSEYNVMLDGNHIAHANFERTLTQDVTPTSGAVQIGSSNIRPAISYFTNAITSAPWGTPVIRFNNQGQCHIMHVDETVPSGQKVYGAFEYNIVAF